MAIDFVKFRKFPIFIYLILIFLSLSFLISFGLKFSVDFVGGTILEFEFEKEFNEKEIKKALSELNLGEFTLISTQKGIILKTKEISEKEHSLILEKLEGAREIRVESIGPSISKELREKAILLTLLSVFAISIYIFVSFSKISQQISPFKLFSISFLASFQSVIFLLGLVSLFGKFFGLSFSIPILVSILTILGYGINDTIVVFDRVRENLIKLGKKRLKEAINLAITQTFSRQINTSLTTIFPLIFIFFFVGPLKFFSLVLIFGILHQTFFSIFLSATLLYPFDIIIISKRSKENLKNEAKERNKN